MLTPKLSTSLIGGRGGGDVNAQVVHVSDRGGGGR